MNTQKLLGVTIKNQSKSYILEKIQKYIRKPYAFFHIVSLNPENIMIGVRDNEFQTILSQGDIQLIDGVGVALGCDILKIPHGERFTGADLMEKVVFNTSLEGLRVLFIGGRSTLAERLAVCYRKKVPKKHFLGIEGYKDIRNQTKEEHDHIYKIIADYKPQIIFAAFGSPWQEKWFDCHKGQLSGIVCVGVGGALDFASGNISRAPALMRRMGFEWLYRLVIQPWRWRRQMRLVTFCWLVLREKLVARS